MRIYLWIFDADKEMKFTVRIDTDSELDRDFGMIANMDVSNVHIDTDIRIYTLLYIIKYFISH